MIDGKDMEFCKDEGDGEPPPPPSATSLCRSLIGAFQEEQRLTLVLCEALAAGDQPLPRVAAELRALLKDQPRCQELLLQMVPEPRRGRPSNQERARRRSAIDERRARGRDGHRDPERTSAPTGGAQGGAAGDATREAPPPGVDAASTAEPDADAATPRSPAAPPGSLLSAQTPPPTPPASTPETPPPTPPASTPETPPPTPPNHGDGATAECGLKWFSVPKICI